MENKMPINQVIETGDCMDLSVRPYMTGPNFELNQLPIEALNISENLKEFWKSKGVQTVGMIGSNLTKVSRKDLDKTLAAVNEAWLKIVQNNAE